MNLSFGRRVPVEGRLPPEGLRDGLAMRIAIEAWYGAAERGQGEGVHGKAREYDAGSTLIRALNSRRSAMHFGRRGSSSRTAFAARFLVCIPLDLG